MWENMFYLPFLKIFQFLSFHLKDPVLTIFVLTLFVKILFFPLYLQAIKTQKKVREINLKIKEIERKFKEDPQKKTKELISLFKEEKINPFFGLIFFVQIPIFFALYRVFVEGIFGMKERKFLKIIDLSLPSIFLAALAALFQYFFSKMNFSLNFDQNKKDFFQRQLPIFFSFFTFFILSKIPAAISLYWLSFNALSIIENYYVAKRDNRKN